jgi:hypothetical protein
MKSCKASGRLLSQELPLVRALSINEQSQNKNVKCLEQLLAPSKEKYFCISCTIKKMVQQKSKIYHQTC